MGEKAQNIGKSPKNQGFRGCWTVPPFQEHPVVVSNYLTKGKVKENTNVPVDVIGMEDHDVSVHAEEYGEGDPCQLEDLQEGVEEVREER